MKLTSHMREALETATRNNNELRRVHTSAAGQPAWPAPAATLAALVRHGHMTPGRRRNRRGDWTDTWTISDTGRLALNPPPVQRPEKPRYMNQTAGTTSNPVRSVDWEWGTITGRDGKQRRVQLPIETPDRLSPSHGEEAQRRWDDALDRHAKANALAKALKAA